MDINLNRNSASSQKSRMNPETLSILSDKSCLKNSPLKAKNNSNPSNLMVEFTFWILEPAPNVFENITEYFCFDVGIASFNGHHSEYEFRIKQKF